MPTYLITQATGVQAQWTITHLLAAGAKVHAVVRDLAKATDLLKSPGVTLFKGESVNFDNIYEAAQGCDGVYINTYPGFEAEQAESITKAALKAGIKAAVVCTVFTAGDKTFWDDEITKNNNLHEYFSSKYQVETIVRNAGFDTFTILRPAFIHTNYLTPHTAVNFPRLPTHGVLDHMYDEQTRMPQTDCSDIGKYVAAALQDPAKFAGQEIEFCDNALTIEEVRSILMKVSGRDVKVRKVTWDQVKAEGIAVSALAFHTWLNAKDFSKFVTVSKEAEAKFGMPFTSFEAALQREKDLLRASLPA